MELIREQIASLSLKYNKLELLMPTSYINELENAEELGMSKEDYRALTNKEHDNTMSKLNQYHDMIEALNKLIK